MLFRWLGRILKMFCDFEFAQSGFRSTILLSKKDSVSTFVSYPPCETAQYPVLYDPHGLI
jgi:hypothetical protein